MTSDQSQAAERDERKRALEAKRRAVEESLVLDMIKARGIKVASIKVTSFSAHYFSCFFR